MVFQMILAHLLGDYVFQTNKLARMKCSSSIGVLLHGIIVAFFTLMLSYPWGADWLPWAGLICISHLAIDYGKFRLSKYLPQNARIDVTMFLLDQLLHFCIIGIALIGGNQMQSGSELFALMQAHPILTVLFGWIVVSNPAWVTIEFFVSCVVGNMRPDFARATKSKYHGIIERALVVTFVFLGQFMLVPLVTLPRLFVASVSGGQSQRRDLVLVEWLASLAVAFVVGLMVRQIS